MRRRAVAGLSIAAVAVGGVLGGTYLVTQGTTKISLSADASHRHHHPESMRSGHRSHAMSLGSGHRSHNMGTGTGNFMARPPTMTGAAFSSLDNQGDPTFNQLLGINNRGVVAGYLGSGAQGHPNKGYLLFRTNHGSVYQSENFPGSLQTQVTGLNDVGVTVGFWSSQNTANMTNNNFGFYSWRGRFHSVAFPTGHNANPPVNQLLGVNNFGVAVGFYTNSQGTNFGYQFNIRSHRFYRVVVPRFLRGRKAPSLTATAINNRGDVAGFFDGRGGVTDAFLKTSGGQFIKLAYPGAAMTQAFGVNDRDEVVGAYTTGSGNAAKSFGFTWSPRTGWTSVSDPQGMGTTLLNGVNNRGDLVGFYNDTAGNTHGMLVMATRRGMMPTQMATPSMSPTGTMTPSMAPTVKPTGMAPPAPQPSPGSTSLGSHS
jgi:hypothetical protein